MRIEDQISRDERILSALWAKSQDRGIPLEERRAFAAKADEVRKRLANRPDLTQDGQTAPETGHHTQSLETPPEGHTRAYEMPTTENTWIKRPYGTPKPPAVSLSETWEAMPLWFRAVAIALGVPAIVGGVAVAALTMLVWLAGAAHAEAAKDDGPLCAALKAIEAKTALALPSAAGPRVVPRDLFNEANLLKCLGRLYIKGEVHADSISFDLNHSRQGFQVWQDEADGSIYVGNLFILINDRRLGFWTPLNSREKWPLWCSPLDDPDADGVEVFDDKGEFTAEFLELIDGSA